MNTRILIPRDEMIAWCRRHHVRKLALFGSTAKGKLALIAISIYWWV